MVRWTVSWYVMAYLLLPFKSANYNPISLPVYVRAFFLLLRFNWSFQLIKLNHTDFAFYTKSKSLSFIVLIKHFGYKMIEIQDQNLKNPTTIFVQTIKCIECNRWLKQTIVVKSKRRNVRTRNGELKHKKANNSNHHHSSNHKSILYRFELPSAARKWEQKIEKEEIQLKLVDFNSSFSMEDKLFSITFHCIFIEDERKIRSIDHIGKNSAQNDVSQFEQQ